MTTQLRYQIALKTLAAVIFLVELTSTLAVLLFFVYQADIFRLLGLQVSWFRFENNLWIRLLPLTFFVPAFTIAYSLWRRRAVFALAAPAHWKKLLPPLRTWVFALQYAFLRWGFLFLLIALANPQYGVKSLPSTLQGVDIMVALDVSRSMETIDQGQSLSRIERAKLALTRLLPKIAGNRIGIIVFAGEAYTLLPLTSDYMAAKNFIAALNTNMVSLQGTHVAAAIDLALESLPFSEPTTKAIILISDGEDHVLGLTPYLTKAKEAKIAIHTVGIGSLEGAPIPDIQNGQMRGYKKDSQGNVVVSQLNETVLQEIAAATDGVYIKAEGANLGLAYLVQRFDEMQKSEIQATDVLQYESYYFVFVLISLFFFALEGLLQAQVSRIKNRGYHL